MSVEALTWKDGALHVLDQLRLPTHVQYVVCRTPEQVAQTLIADNMAAALMQQKKVDMVVVGADRITAHGDVANKIGTYALAVLCRFHHVPFYVAAPLSSIDRSISEPSEIKIEERPSEELIRLGGVDLAPPGVRVYNPAFDVTPCYLVSAIVTPVGLLYPPFFRSITWAFDKQAVAEGSVSGEV